MNTRKINLSINPTYWCNFRCNFCYLTPEQLSQKEQLDLKALSRKLHELQSQNIRIGQVDLYGGEIGLLQTDYLESLISLVQPYSENKINIITNLSVINQVFLDSRVALSVSYDFKSREKHELVFKNMCQIEKPLSVLMLASPSLMSQNVDLMISYFNSISQIKSVEIKPYSTNQANRLPVQFSDYENFIQKWIQAKTAKRFKFINEELILDSLDQVKNAFSDDHLYITPKGEWAVLEFDTNDHEYFKTLADLAAYNEWTVQEKIKIKNNSFCSKCNYLGRCLTEHYRDVKSLENSCNGFKGLLDWSELHYEKSHQEQNNLYF